MYMYKIFGEKRITIVLQYPTFSSHGLFFVHETQQSIVVILLIIYPSYSLEVLLEFWECIGPRTAIS